MKYWISISLSWIIVVASSTENSASPPEIINPYPFQVIQDTEPCTAEHRVLIVVHSSPKVTYTRRRMLMRSSWLQPENLEKLLGLKVKIIFMLGASGSGEMERYLHYESEIYRDIVQSDFIDSYRNNTYKAMSFLRWTAENCADAAVLLKTDDDLLLRKDKFKELKSIIDLSVKKTMPFYIGKGMDRRPHRAIDNKWYVSIEEWPDKYYPIYFQGLAIFLSPSITGKLYRQALKTKYLFTDDVYIGILVDRLKNSEDRDLRTDIHITEVEHLTSPLDDVRRLGKPWYNVHDAALYHVPYFKQFWEWHSMLVNS